MQMRQNESPENAYDLNSPTNWRPIRHSRSWIFVFAAGYQADHSGHKNSRNFTIRLCAEYADSVPMQAWPITRSGTRWNTTFASAIGPDLAGIIAPFWHELCRPALNSRSMTR
jgi:hypothetical protein